MKNTAQYPFKGLRREAGALLFLGCLLAVSCFPAFADDGPPDVISYQGFLKDDQGSVIDGENHEIVFRIYGVESEGTSLWAERQTVTLDNGYFSVMLGLGGAVENEDGPDTAGLTLASVFSDSERWIGLTVDEDGEIEPRLKFLASPYAFTASEALTAKSADSVQGDVISVAGEDDALTVAVGNNLSVGKDLDVVGDLEVGEAITGSSLDVSGAADVGALDVTGSVNIGNVINVGTEARVTSKVITSRVETTTLDVSGAAEVGSLIVEGELDGETLDVSGAANVGSLTASGSLQGAILDVSGAADVGTLDVTGSVNIGNVINVATEARITGDLVAYDTIRATGNDSISPTDTSKNQSDSLRFYSHDEGSVWSVGSVHDAGDSDDELSFSFNYGSGWEGIGYLEPDGTGWKTWSDRRLKTDIEPIGDGVLDALMNVPPVRYRNKSRSSDSVKLYGFIAQDVAAAFPGFVDTTDETLALNYARFGVFTLAGLQELRREKDSQVEELVVANEALKQENEELRSQFDALLSRLTALEAKVQ